jgi:nucleotide-binding universal stress UspA family protein
MKKLLVPTDFSDTSKNAALFAVQMAADIQNARIILIHVSDKIAGGSDGSPLTEDDDDRRTILGDALTQLKEELLATAKVQVPVDFDIEKGSSLVETLSRYVRHQAIDLVIMGITGATRLEQIFMGSNTLDMAKESVCPVLIIPPDAQYRKIKNVVLASDFKDVDVTIPEAPLKATLDLFKPNLHIVNVDSEHYVELTDDYKAERRKLETMLQGYAPEFYFIRQYDFFDAISQFVDDKNIDLLVIVPRERSFLTGFFKTSHTKKLAYHSHIPIVAIRQ